MTRWLAVILLAATCAACGNDGGDPLLSGNSGPDRPQPSAPSTGPVAAEVAIDETMFLLREEGEGCVALEVRHPGLQPTVERRCFERDNVLEVSNTCGWFEAPEAAGDMPLALSPVFDCDVDLPAVLYGRVSDPAIGYVCLGTMHGEDGAVGVTGARFIDFGSSGYILAAAVAGEETAAHVFTADGLRYGTPPLDAPSAPIYEACENLAPWGQPGLEYLAELAMTAAEELRRENITLFLDTSLDSYAVTGEAFDHESQVVHPGRVAATSTGVTVRVERDGAEVFSAAYPWPDPLRQILASGTPCTERIVVDFAIQAGVLDADTSGVQLSMRPPPCGDGLTG